MRLLLVFVGSGRERHIAKLLRLRADQSHRPRLRPDRAHRLHAHSFVEQCAGEDLAGVEGGGPEALFFIGRLRYERADYG